MLLNPRTIRPPWAGILGVLVALGMTACSDHTTPPEGDPSAADYPGIDELGRPLRQLASAGCTIASKVLTINVAANETALIGKSSTSAITVNGTACGTATTSTVTKVTVAAAAPSTVILDYSNGTFMTGSATAVGFDITFTGASNSNLKVRGSSSADTFYVGGTGTAVKMAVNADTNADVQAAASGGGSVAVVVSGGPGNDTLSGAGGFGTGSSAFTGDLWLWGGTGNDTITGGAGNDKVVGGDGDDVLSGGSGNDTLWGEAGNDTFKGETGTGTGNDYYFGGTGPNSTSTDVMDYSLRTSALTVVMDATWTGDYVSGSATGTLSGYSGESDLIGADIENFIGGSGNDTITGNALNNRLEGRAGNDTFIETSDTSTDVFVGFGGTGSETDTGDTVNYSVRTNAVTLRISGTAVSGETGENDTISTDIENLIGGQGNDTLWGSSGNNTLTGGPGNDILHAGAGDDVLIGSDGDDTLYGEDGDDVFLASNATSTDGDDVIFCGAGIDALDYSARTADMTVNLAQGGTSTGLSGESDTISNASSTTDDCENAVGGIGGNNTITGNSLDNILDGYTATGTTIDGAAGTDVCIDVVTASTTNCEL